MVELPLVTSLYFPVDLNYFTISMISLSKIFISIFFLVKRWRWKMYYRESGQGMNHFLHLIPSGSHTQRLSSSTQASGSSCRTTLSASLIFRLPVPRKRLGSTLGPLWGWKPTFLLLGRPGSGIRLWGTHSSFFSSSGFPTLLTPTKPLWQILLVG